MMKRILQLDNQLANQIAAGEVVERPASVVKELLENSVDAGASRITIDIERGGARLIRIIDNGGGIHPDDLPLALSRHATSKISQFSELCAVQTLGFRGEALASIASVAKLLLRSRITGQEQGWQAMAEGRDMAVTVTPAAATEGTCVEVRDLFYNTPARRKFLRTEKTEFAHIEDVVKREALAIPSVAFVLKNNGTVIKRYPAAKDHHGMQQKLSAACGSRFIKHASAFMGEIDDLKIHGWVGSPEYHRSESDTQLLFVNGRPVKDRMLSHAVRQSYAERIPTGRFATYVIYIECIPNLVDVNVHPTKHEVKFAQPRQVHDFLVKLTSDALQQLTVSHMTNEISFAQDGCQKESQGGSGYENREASLFDSIGQVTAFVETHSGIAAENEVAESDTIAKPIEPPANFDSVKATELSEPAPKYFGSTHARKAVPVVPHSPTQVEVAEHHRFYKQIADATTTLQIDNNDFEQKRSAPILRQKIDSELWQQRYLSYPLDDRLWVIDVWRWVIEETKEVWGQSNYPSKPLLIPKALNIQTAGQFEDVAVFERFMNLGIELTPCSPQQLLLRRLPAIPTPISEAIWLMAMQSTLTQAKNEFDQIATMQKFILSCLNDSTPDSAKLLLEWSEQALAKDAAKATEYSEPSWRPFAWSISVQEIAQRIG